MVVVEANVVMWGTWEELVLGGAVLRHGTEDWNAVVLELRSRVLSPCYLTPEVCKAKYEDLRKRYSACSAWYEELRKRRVEDLKRELEKSNDAIGSLESKVKRLKSERCSSNQVRRGTHADSPAPLKSEDVQYSGRETPKDGLSAGSFTQDTSFNFLSECRIPAVTSMLLSDMETEISRPLKQKEGGDDIKKNVEDNIGSTIRKRRGNRKRKDSCAKDAKEGSLPESDNLGSTNADFSASQSKETSASECNQTLVSSRIDGHSRDLCRVISGDDVMRIFISIAQNELASVFRHRLDSQKRARYKKIIRQHLDFGILRSRIDEGTIKSVKELL